ncbi:MAG: 4Fe-4S dicluster domain-containing protein [Planctomycetota bacterium]|nr:MAG: 4Fe-4S dicluster domain-containing protein [Planctomycetota bacterium]
MQVPPGWEYVFPVATVLAAGLLLMSLIWARLRGDRTRARLRLDIFLPVLRRRKHPGDGQHAALRLAHAVFPATWFSNPRTKQRGAVRRALRRLGITWLAAPWRRVTQATCLITFLWLWFYVCWPYSARPVDPRHQSISGWKFSGIDASTGHLLFLKRTEGESSQKDGWTGEDPLYVVRPSSGTTQVALVRAARLVDRQVNQLRLALDGGLDDVFLAAVVDPTATDWYLSRVDPTAWPSHYADHLHRRERLPAEFFLAIDPLVALSTAIASRSWVWSLASAAAILAVCLVIPRGFCGYLCPLGTTIDLFDWAIGRRVTRFRVSGEGWWVHLKYYILAAVLIAAWAGVLISGFVAAIPVVTRAALLLLEPLQIGWALGWHQIPPMHAGHWLSIALFGLVLGLGFLRPRFWCKYVCPSGAVFSVFNAFRLTERKVESSCIHCNKCVEICPFDAIKPDFTTRTSDCTLCQTCAGVCPTHAIKFVERNNVVELKLADDPPTGETVIGRRGFVSWAAGSAAAVAGGWGAARLLGGDPGSSEPPIRPPGSVPEDEFLDKCIRCGECFKVCPNHVLQLQGWDQGWEGLWTPVVRPDWAGCESSCNACGQVCPTGAIRALPIEEKRWARMGLAIVDQSACLPYAGREDCDLCVQECNAAGYHAIEYTTVGTQVDPQGQPIEGSGFLAPVVRDDRCVGCGLCQTRCYAINVKDRHVLSGSAIVVHAGPGREDRIASGSYRRDRATMRADAAKSTVTREPASNSTTAPVAEPVTAPDSSPPQPAGADGQNLPPDFGDNPFGL